VTVFSRAFVLERKFFYSVRMDYATAFSRALVMERNSFIGNIEVLAGIGE